MHRGDVNQGITIGTASFQQNETTKVISLDTSVHPTDLAPSVQLTPIGSEQNINVFTSATAVAAGVWKVTITRSSYEHYADKVNYMIISRIEPKHIVDHTVP